MEVYRKDPDWDKHADANLRDTHQAQPVTSGCFWQSFAQSRHKQDSCRQQKAACTAAKNVQRDQKTITPDFHFDITALNYQPMPERYGMDQSQSFRKLRSFIMILLSFRAVFLLVTGIPSKQALIETEPS